MTDASLPPSINWSHLVQIGSVKQVEFVLEAICNDSENKRL